MLLLCKYYVCGNFREVYLSCDNRDAIYIKVNIKLEEHTTSGLDVARLTYPVYNTPSVHPSYGLLVALLKRCLTY